MILPEKWLCSCGMQCNEKYSLLTQIPWRIFCKKGCNSDTENWEECVEACNLLCYKDPVVEDKPWTAYIDRSPGAASHSAECFRACTSGCGYKFDIEKETVDKVTPTGRPELPAVNKPKPPVGPIDLPPDITSTSA